MKPKTKKILNIVLDVVIAIVLVFAAFLAVISIRSKVKGYNDYTEVFGSAYVAVASESMSGTMPDYVPQGKLEGFEKGDLIKINLTDEKEVQQLEVGDIITFRTGLIVQGKKVLNTHRIIEIESDTEGKIVKFRTRGDNNPAADSDLIKVDDVVGVYEGKASGIGHVFLFMSSSAGFFVCIVLPTLLIVVYCVVNLVLVIQKEKKVQVAEAEIEKQAEKERIRQELLAEMQSAVQQDAEPATESVDEEDKKED